MANTTDRSFASARDDYPGTGGAPVEGNADDGGAPPFGDPDQRLYGGSGQSWTVPSPAPKSGDSPYEGRHRAAE